MSPGPTTALAQAIVASYDKVRGAVWVEANSWSQRGVMPYCAKAVVCISVLQGTNDPSGLRGVGLKFCDSARRGPAGRRRAKGDRGWRRRPLCSGNTPHTATRGGLRLRRRHRPPCFRLKLVSGWLAVRRGRRLSRSPRRTPRHGQIFYLKDEALSATQLDPPQAPTWSPRTLTRNRRRALGSPASVASRSTARTSRCWTLSPVWAGRSS